MKEGLPWKPWVAFLDRLMQNESEYCRKQLFNYVEKYGLPLDSSGFVWGYRAVQKNYFDKYTGKTHCYKVGKVIKMDRNKCEKNPKIGCAPSLHVGTADYVSSYGGGDDRYLLVRFSPKDVISCPDDSNWSKLRVCKLKVMREVKREDIFPLGDAYGGKNGKKFKRNKLGQFAKK
jgi:hypothetical protein